METQKVLGFKNHLDMALSRGLLCLDIIAYLAQYAEGIGAVAAAQAALELATEEEQDAAQAEVGAAKKELPANVQVFLDTYGAADSLGYIALGAAFAPMLEQVLDNPEYAGLFGVAQEG